MSESNEVVVNVEFHHHSDRSSYKLLLDIPASANQIAYAILIMFQREYNVGFLEDLGMITEAVERSIAAQKEVKVRFYYEDVVERTDNKNDYDEYVIWVLDRDDKPAVHNIGLGSDTDKANNIWLELKPFVPDPGMSKILDEFNREQLLAVLFRTHAMHGLSFPPSVGS